VKNCRSTGNRVCVRTRTREGRRRVWRRTITSVVCGAPCSDAKGQTQGVASKKGERPDTRCVAATTTKCGHKVWLREQGGQPRQRFWRKNKSKDPTQSVAEKQASRPGSRTDGETSGQRVVHSHGPLHVHYDSLICKVYHCTSHVF
jgi:hypothetical protein